MLQVGADVGSDRHKRPVEGATQQAQRQGQIGIVLQQHRATLDGAAQAVGKAKTLQTGEAALGHAHSASSCQQIELLRVAVKDGMQLAPVLAQQFPTKDDSVRPHRQRRAAGVLHAVARVAPHSGFEGHQFVGHACDGL